MSSRQEDAQNSPVTDNVILLKLSEIAAWQIEHLSVQSQRVCMAELPALQRGAVWKPEQIEALWDSILQGFPLGAFLLTPFDANLGKQDFPHQKTTSAQILPRTHMLLDGQQRANGIALGFLNPWHDTPPASDVRSVLWIDLVPPLKERDVAYVFRVVTRAHPWGYSLADPERPVSQHQIRQSLHAFRAANAPQYKEDRPNQIPLHAVWPWDAKAPVPVSLLIQALYETRGIVAEAKERAWQIIQQLPFIRVEAKEQQDSPYKYATHWLEQQNVVRQTFKGPDTRLDEILALLWQRVSEYVIPANVVPKAVMENMNQTTADSGLQSAIETLFIRVNSAGTPLGGEELIYSLIKSSWKDAPEAIAALAHKLATPARTAMLASRLVRARHQREQYVKGHREDTSRLRLIPTPGVDDFRRLMLGQNNEHKRFAKDLEAYVTGQGLQVFEYAYRFLTEDKYGLPPVLATELAQKSPDIFFLFLCWLDRRRLEGNEVEGIDNISEPTKRRVLGFLTALSWFAKTDSKARAVDAIWHELQTIDSKDLQEFFNRKHFLRTMTIDNNGKQHMIPVVSPDVLEHALKVRILGHQGCQDTIRNQDSAIWRGWNWWQWLIDNKRPQNIDEALHFVLHQEKLAEGETTSDRIRDMWGQFMEALRHNRSMLLYVQRDWIKLWFPDFDPSLPEFMEDKNRPWDYDHIYPKKLLQGQKGGTLHGIPSIIKEWHNSIGNLRAWPLEANRSDSATPPSQKLKEEDNPEEEASYGIPPEKKFEASFISREHYEKYWSQCKGKGLNGSETFPERQALVNAIVWRFLVIYRQWYNDLKLSTLS